MSPLSWACHRSTIGSGGCGTVVAATTMGRMVSSLPCFPHFSADWGESTHLAGLGHLLLFHFLGVEQGSLQLLPSVVGALEPPDMGKKAESGHPEK